MPAACVVAELVDVVGPTGMPQLNGSRGRIVRGGGVAALPMSASLLYGHAAPKARKSQSVSWALSGCPTDGPANR